MMETERLLLRKFTLDDAADAYAMNSDPLVCKYIVGEGKTTLENVRALIKNNTLGFRLFNRYLSIRQAYL